MRKVATAAVATAVAALGFVGVAQAVTADSIQTTSTFKLSGGKGTAKKHKSQKLKTDIETGSSNAADVGSFATSKTVLFFDKNLVFNPKAFPTCTEAQANANGGSACAKAQVGTGSASAAAGPAGAGQIKLSPTIKYYNGAGSTLIIALSDPTGLSNGTIIGKLKSASGAFGKKLDVTIPAKYQRNLGLIVTLTSFKANISKSVTKSGKKVGYVESKGCPSGGKYKFQSQFTFVQSSNPADPNAALTTAGSKTVPYSSKC